MVLEYGNDLQPLRVLAELLRERRIWCIADTSIMTQSLGNYIHNVERSTATAAHFHLHIEYYLMSITYVGVQGT